MLGRVGAQSTCCLHEGRTSLSVTVVIEAPNESHANVSMILLLDRGFELLVMYVLYIICFGERNNCPAHAQGVRFVSSLSARK